MNWALIEGQDRVARIPDRPMVGSRSWRSIWSTWTIDEVPIFWKILGIVFVAFAMRVVVRCYSGSADFWVNGYTFFFALAQNIADGKGISISEGNPTAFRVPLYPIFLTMVTFGHKAFLPVVLAQSLIGTATVLFAALIAREVFGNAAAITAAIITAAYPYYVVHDTALQETGLYTFLTALAVLLLLRTRRSGSGVTAACAGVALGAAVLTRANLAPFALIAPLYLAVPGACQPLMLWRQKLGLVLVCASAVALTVSPWLVRSFLLTGSVTLSTQTGYFLWVGNNSCTFRYYPQGSIDRSEEAALMALTSQDRAELEVLGDNEAAVDQWFRQRGLEYIREHPWRTLGSGALKLSDVFGWLPSPRKSFWPNLVHSLAYGLVMTLGLWGMWAGRKHWREHLIFYALFISFAAVTAVFFGHTSYRSYLDVYWIVFAADSLEQLRNKFLPLATLKWWRPWNAPTVSSHSTTLIEAAIAGKPVNQSTYFLLRRVISSSMMTAGRLQPYGKP
jgi:4-amino-4-deoxy-L-arabinose transferase-like glycosyltransferase